MADHNGTPGADDANALPLSTIRRTAPAAAVDATTQEMPDATAVGEDVLRRNARVSSATSLPSVDLNEKQWMMEMQEDDDDDDTWRAQDAREATRRAEQQLLFREHNPLLKWQFDSLSLRNTADAITVSVLLMFYLVRAPPVVGSVPIPADAPTRSATLRGSSSTSGKRPASRRPGARRGACGARRRPGPGGRRARLGPANRQVPRTHGLWVAETTLAFITLPLVFWHITAIRVNAADLTTGILILLLDIVTLLPFFIGIAWTALRQLYVPTFLRIWDSMLVLYLLLSVLPAMGQQRWILARAIVLCYSIMAFMITFMCAFHWSENGFTEPSPNYSMFKSIYFVLVTIATVGYGDIVPNNVVATAFVFVLILSAVVLVPYVVTELLRLFQDYQRYNLQYSKHGAR